MKAVECKVWGLLLGAQTAERLQPAQLTRAVGEGSPPNELGNKAWEDVTWTCLVAGPGFQIYPHAKAAKTGECLLSDLFGRCCCCPRSFIIVFDGGWTALHPASRRHKHETHGCAAVHASTEARADGKRFLQELARLWGRGRSRAWGRMLLLHLPPRGSTEPGLPAPG